MASPSGFGLLFRFLSGLALGLLLGLIFSLAFGLGDRPLDLSGLWSEASGSATSSELASLPRPLVKVPSVFPANSPSIAFFWT